MDPRLPRFGGDPTEKFDVLRKTVIVDGCASLFFWWVIFEGKCVFFLLLKNKSQRTVASGEGRLPEGPHEYDMKR